MANNQIVPLPIIIGYTIAERADAREGLQLDDFGAETDKTNFKRQDKFLTNIASVKLLGQLTRIVAVDANHLDPQTKKVVPAFFDSAALAYESDFAKAGFRNPSHAFAGWLLNSHGPEKANRINRAIRGGNDLVFYGFGLKPMFRVLGPECNVDARFPIPLGLWFQNEDCWDPYDMMVESEYRGGDGHPPVIPMEKVLRRVGMRLREGYVQHADAMTDCVLAGEMVYRLGLVSDHDRAELGKLLKLQVDEKSVDEEKQALSVDIQAQSKKSKKKKAG